MTNSQENSFAPPLSTALPPTIAPSSTTPSQASLPSAPRILKDSINFYLSHWEILLPIALIPIIPNIINLFLGKNALTIPLGLINFLLSFIAPLALMYAVTRKGEAKIGESYSKGLKFIIPAGWIALLSSLASIGGFFLLIIPGIIVGLWISLSVYAFFLENLVGTKALARSWYLIRGYSLAVFWRYLFLGLIISFVTIISTSSTFFPLLKNGAFSPERLETLTTTSSSSIAISMFFLLLSGLIIKPLNTIYYYLIFNLLRDKKPQAPSQEEEKKIRRNVLIFIWLGVLSIIVILVIIFSGLFLVISKFGNNANPTSNPLFDISKFPDFAPSPNIAIPSLPPTENPAI